MSYKIAVASSDEKQIDETFGSAKRFLIYEVTEDGYRKSEERVFEQAEADDAFRTLPEGESLSSGCESRGCGSAGGCGNGAGGGCGGQGEASAKVELVSDCRCIVCKKIGFHIQKQLERKAISAFDVSCSVQEALNKISYYFNRMDKHESFRGRK